MLSRVKELVGRDVSKLVNKPTNGSFIVGTPPADSEKLIFSDDLTLTKFTKPDRPLAGADGLAQLVEAGKLRPATQKDIDAWVETASAEFKHLNPDLKVETRMRPERTYVVLGPFDMPAGLFGSHLRSFIVPEGAPLPGGNPGHCDFYYMDGTQEGPGNRGPRRSRASQD